MKKNKCYTANDLKSRLAAKGFGGSREFCDRFHNFLEPLIVRFNRRW